MSALSLDNVYPTKSQQGFTWTEERSKAATVLASGGTKQEAADEVGVNRSTIYEWLQYPDFCEEIDRLSLMVGAASRAQRLRWINRTIASKIKEDGGLLTEKDVLDWLKFAQSETTGAKIDLSKLGELLAGENAQDSGVNATSEHNRLLAQSSESIIEVEASSGGSGPASSLSSLSEPGTDPADNLNAS